MILYTCSSYYLLIALCSAAFMTLRESTVSPEKSARREGSCNFPSLYLSGFQIRCLALMRERKCFLSLVLALETLCPKPQFFLPACCQAGASCRLTLVVLLHPLKACNIKKKQESLVKKPVAVNLVPGTLVFSTLNTLFFPMTPFHA